MASLVGRKVTFTPTGSGIPITGMRTKTITVNNEAIDITSDDDRGWQTFLATDPAQRGIDMSVEGVTKDAVLINLAVTGGSGLISEYELAFEGLGTFTGDFHIGSLELGASYNEAVTFSCTIRSSGEPTWLAA
jgi:predicted secreted protein